MHDPQSNGAPELITLEEAQARLPADSGGSKPTTRWINNRARKLNCYIKNGKVACIHADALPYFLRNEPWPVGGKTALATGSGGIAEAVTAKQQANNRSHGG